MNIIALDLASKKTGYAIYKDGKIIESDTWNFKPSNPKKSLDDKLTPVLEKYNISLVVCEDYFIDKTKTSATWKRLAEMHGALDLITAQNNLPSVELISPLLAKRTMRVRTYTVSNEPISREKQKASMIRHVQNLGYRLKTDKSDDEADAIGIMITYLDQNNIPVTHPKQ